MFLIQDETREKAREKKKSVKILSAHLMSKTKTLFN